MNENEHGGNRHLEDFGKSVTNLKQSLEVDQPDDLVQDAIIKRFELSYELAWKAMKVRLEHLGIFCSSPRECFKQAKANDLIKDEKGWLAMIETRNVLVHTYNAEKLREMIDMIRNEHMRLLDELQQKLTEAQSGNGG